jgi:hypothetical protein
MAVFDTTAPQEPTTQDWTPLATGEYVMKIADATIAPSQFPDENGEFPEQLTVVWELDEWREEFDDAGYFKGQRVYQRMKPTLRPSSKGPSNLAKIATPLIEAGLIPPKFEEGDLIGHRMKVLVENYPKTMGPNKGKPGNKVLTVSPIKQALRKPKPVDLAEADDIAGVVEQTPIDGMRTDELRKYAKMLAKAAGGVFAKRDWDDPKLTGEFLRMQIKSMQNMIERNKPSDPDEDLFGE